MRLEDNNKIDLKEVGCEYGRLIELSETQMAFFGISGVDPSDSSLTVLVKLMKSGKTRKCHRHLAYEGRKIYPDLHV